MRVYRELIETLLDVGYRPARFDEYLASGPSDQPVVVLRHDVDKKPLHALRMARLQADVGATGTYFFRILPGVFAPAVMKEIASLGHEIGYHYEDLALADGDMKRALTSFEENLRRMREHCRVTTVCMHGSPMSRWDNREMWKHQDFGSYGLLGDPYLSVDFERLLYLTDTGRRWDGHRVSVRDKVGVGPRADVSSTHELIHLLRTIELPSAIMKTVHPQRWTDALAPWTAELFGQRIKNVVKRVVARRHAAASDPGQ